MREPIPIFAIGLRRLRQAAGWTQGKLEAAAHIGRGTVSLYEKGKRTFDRRQLDRFARLLGHDSGAVDRALVAEAQLPASEAIEVVSPASLLPAERRAVEAAAGRAAQYSAAVVRAKAGSKLVTERLRRERNLADELWLQLRGLPEVARRRRAVDDARFHNWALCERICEASVNLSGHSVGKALQTARLALLIAEKTSGSQCWKFRLQGFAWAFVGNALRVGGDLPRAEDAIRKSDELWSAGAAVPAFPLDEGFFLLCKATLRFNQGQPQEALLLQDRALAASATEAGRARVLLSRSITLASLDRYEDALASLSLAAPWIESNAEPRWRCSLWFQRIDHCCRAGRFGEAAEHLEKLREIAFDQGYALDELRCQWLEARVAAGLGDRDRAAEGISTVLNSFARERIPFDAALAALELAALELERGRVQEVKALASTTAFIFASQEIPNQLLASLRLFWQAVLQEEATADGAHRLLRELDRWSGQRGERSVGTR